MCRLSIIIRRLWANSKLELYWIRSCRIIFRFIQCARGNYLNLEVFSLFLRVTKSVGRPQKYLLQGGTHLVFLLKVETYSSL
jgi:hypothetical protein